MEPTSPPPTGGYNYLAELAWVLAAMVGGVARYLDSYIQTGTMPRVGLLFANAFVSGFSGYMAAHVALHLAPDWAMVAAGTAGWLGTQGMNWVADVVKRRVGGQVDGGDRGDA